LFNVDKHIDDPDFKPDTS